MAFMKLQTTKKGRQRQVFPTSEIPHKWAHAAQESGRNPQGNLFFRGASIYSYRESWPLARIYRNRRGALVLSNSNTYSMTTAQHQHAVNRAVSHLDSISVPCVEWDRGEDRESHAANLDYLAGQAAGLLAKAQRAMTLSRVEHAERTARGMLEKAEQYAAFFRVRRKVPEFPAAAWESARLRAAAIEHPDPVRDAKRYRARELRRTRLAAALQGVFSTYSAEMERYNAARQAQCANLPDPAQYWREHGEFPRVPDAPQSAPQLSGSWKERRRMLAQLRQAGFTLPAQWEPDTRFYKETLLRLDGDQIQTSHGARVPVSVAPVVWALVERSRLNGAEYVADRLGIASRVRIGDYPLDRIDADGTLHAGCHRIGHAELARMARTLNLEGAPS